jgi:hypothetical protein
VSTIVPLLLFFVLYGVSGRAVLIAYMLKDAEEYGE